MTECPFGQGYADLYDAVYKDKDYLSECDLLESAFCSYATGRVRRILDLGCGTGNHSLLLAERGYEVTGVERSAEMLRIAQLKSNGAEAGRVRWLHGDIRHVDAGGLFDAVLFMFAVLGYFAPNKDVMAALGNARRHIRVGGTLVFDVWYGPAVLAIRPSNRSKTVDTPSGRMLRYASARLDIRHHLCEVRYQLGRAVGDRLDVEVEELHNVRYFFPMELELMLSQSGFRLQSLMAFPTLDRPADERTWTVLVVANAV